MIGKIACVLRRLGVAADVLEVAPVARVLPTGGRLELAVLYRGDVRLQLLSCVLHVRVVHLVVIPLAVRLPRGMLA